MSAQVARIGGKLMLRAAVALATGIALTTSACGGDGSPATDEGDTAKAEETIATVLEAQGRFDSFLEIITDRGPDFLPRALNQRDRKLTVLAPTDDVFEALPSGTLDSLLAEENRRVLTDFLFRHVLPTELTREDFDTRGNLHTFAPSLEPSQVTVDEGTVMISGGSGTSTVTVIEFGIEASNGIVHVVDGLIVPEDMSPSPAP